MKKMEDYLKKKKELSELAKTEAEKIANKLISESRGKTTCELRNLTLEYINQNSIPEDIAFKLKKSVDDFISNIKVPVQKN